MDIKPTYNPTVGQLLSLVRAALWQTTADCRPFAGTPAVWNDIGRLAMLQTVGALAVEGAASLPPDLMPPKEWLHKGYALAELNRRTHHLLDSCVAEIFSQLTEAGITPVLLKGQAYARAYPDPTLRQCGDIDIYVGEDGYITAYEVSRRCGWEGENKFMPEAKHYRCALKGVKIELHRTAAVLSPHRTDRLFRRWSANQLDAGCRHMYIGGKAVAVPTPMFDVVFVFMHMFHHFVNGGVGLRQVCDWTMLLHIHAGSIDRHELKNRLRDFGLLKAWRLFSPIAVDHIGLPQEECPLYTPRYGRKAGIILSFIISEGNFGKALKKDNDRPEGYIAGKLYSFRMQSGRLTRKLHIDPVLMTRCHYRFIRHGIRAVWNDLWKKHNP